MSKASNAMAMYETAKIWRNQSKCTRLKVGAVLAANGKIISHGYNGTPKNFKYNCDDLFKYDGRTPMISQKLKTLLTDYDGDIPSKRIEVDGTFYYKTTVDIFKMWHHRFSDIYEIHAEPNAIMSVFVNGTNIKSEDMVLFVTTAPCEMCCKLIGQIGIKTVVYGDAYDRFGVQHIQEILDNFGVKIYQIDDYIKMLERGNGNKKTN